MKIVKYRTENKKEVQKLIKTVLFEIFGKHKLEPFENFEEYAIFYVLEDKNKIVGSIGLRKDKDSGIVKRMYIYKNYRNKGLAQKLYDKIEVYVRKNKIKTLKLSTTPQMLNAMKFYKKNGYKKVREEKETNKIFFKKVLKWLQIYPT